MPIKITNEPLSWPQFDIDPGWVPLHRAPFVYRTCSGEDWCEGWEDGTPDHQLASWLRQSGLRDATVDSSSGEIMLILPEGASGSFNLPVCCHPAEFDPDDIRDEQLRSTVSEQILFVWSRMQDEFIRAVNKRRCVIVARAGSILNGFTPIVPDMFRNFEVMDWLNGEAVNTAGEKLFSLHAAPPNFGSLSQPESRAQLQPGSVTAKICDYLRLKYPNGKPYDESYDRIAARFKEDTKLKVSESWVRQTAQNYLGWPTRGRKA